MEENLYMKFVPVTFCYLKKLIIFLFVLLLVNAALAEKKIIRCKTADEESFRVWKVNSENGGIKLWTLNNNNFFPFCTVGHSIEFPNGLLCAYKKDKRVGTVATFIDIEKLNIIDMIIHEDTVLSDPSTWKQKIETDCELIRE